MTVTSGVRRCCPAIDLRGGRVVRLAAGRLRPGDRVLATTRSPSRARFADAGARWLHVVDLDGARTGRRPTRRSSAGSSTAVGDRVARRGRRRAPRRRARSPPCSPRGRAGGGRDRRSARSGLRRPPRRRPRTRERIAVAIDVRDGRAVGQGWAAERPASARRTPWPTARGPGVTTFEVTAIERDGLLAGPDLDLLGRSSRSDRAQRHRVGRDRPRRRPPRRPRARLRGRDRRAGRSTRDGSISLQRWAAEAIVERCRPATRVARRARPRSDGADRRAAYERRSRKSDEASLAIALTPSRAPKLLSGRPTPRGGRVTTEMRHPR